MGFSTDLRGKDKSNLNIEINGLRDSACFIYEILSDVLCDKSFLYLVEKLKKAFHW